MEKYFNEFNAILEVQDKEKAVNYILNLLQSGETDIFKLYSDIIIPSLTSMVCHIHEKNTCVWKEHVRTSILRTIVECCYSYVLTKKSELKPKDKGTAIILCPPQEYQELNARICSDFFCLAGYKSIFAGSNTPFEDFYNVAEILKPKVIYINVHNYYNIFVTKKIIKSIKARFDSSVKIVVGGNAFMLNKGLSSTIGSDFYADTFEEINKII